MHIIEILDNSLLAKINKISFFQYLNEVEKKELLKIADFFEYYKDEKIITQGEVSSCFYAVISGNLNVTVNNENGKEITISVINEGDFFGETGIFTNSQRTANVSPKDTAQIIRIGRNDFFNYLRLYPKAGVNIMMFFVQGLMKRLNSSNQELAVEKATLDKILFFEKLDQ